MENWTPAKKFPLLCGWDVDKYSSKYPAEHWDLCRLFMLAHQTKYSEARLVQLTEAFYNKGVLGYSSDSKTDRMVAALSVPVIEHVLYSHPGAVTHPFHRQAVENPIDPGQSVQPRSVAKSEGPSSEAVDVKPPNNSGVRPAEQQDTSNQPPMTFENIQNILESLISASESQTSSSKEPHCPVNQPVSKKQEEKLLAEKRGFAELKTEPDKVSDDQHSGVSETKRKRLATEEKKSDSKDTPDNVDCRLKIPLDFKEMKNLLIGFVIIYDVTKDSTLGNDLEVVEDSFKRSKFGPCTWKIDKIDENNDVKRVNLLLDDVVLMQGEGKDTKKVQLKMATAFLDWISPFCPVVKATYSYYQDGRRRPLPKEWNYKRYVKPQSFKILKPAIDKTAQISSFEEMIILHHPGHLYGARIQEITEYIDNEKADKLRYRLAKFVYGREHQAICISYNHSGIDLVKHLNKPRQQHMYGRYSLETSFKEQSPFREYRQEFWEAVRKEESNKPSDNNRNNKKEKEKDTSKSARRPSPKNTLLHSKSDQVSSLKNNAAKKTVSSQPQSKNEGSQVQNPVTKDHNFTEPSTPKPTYVNPAQSHSFAEPSTPKQTYVKPVLNYSFAESSNLLQINVNQSPNFTEPDVPKQTSVNPAQNPNLAVPFSPQTAINPVRKDKNEDLSWIDKEYLSTLSKLIYLVKFVKEDSTTDRNPLNILNSVCSLAFNVEIKFSMKMSEDKTWNVLVLLKCDRGNILVGEAKSKDCSEARLQAAHKAVETIQARCRVVEPNFKYFAEGGVPSFISLKNPLKTSTYEIMIIDTIKNPLNQLVVNLLLEMFIEDKSLEDLFFLSSDYTSEERELIRKTAIQYNLGWRLFGQRSRAANPNDIVSNQHVCVFRPKTATELVQQLIVSGGSTDKYSIVTKHLQKANVSPVVPGTSIPSVPSAPKMVEPICDDERLPGGCFNPNCSRRHINILDCVVNQYFRIRPQT